MPTTHGFYTGLASSGKKRNNINVATFKPPSSILSRSTSFQHPCCRTIVLCICEGEAGTWDGAALVLTDPISGSLLQKMAATGKSSRSAFRQDTIH